MNTVQLLDYLLSNREKLEISLTHDIYEEILIRIIYLVLKIYGLIPKGENKNES